MMLVQRHAEVLHTNAKQDFDRCIKRAEPLQTEMKGYDTARWNCISDYKNELKARVP